MDAYTLATMVYGNDEARAIVGLMLANVLAGIAAALYRREFRLAEIADWLVTRAIPYLLGAGAVQLVLLTVPPDWSTLSQTLGDAVWGFCMLSMVGHVLSTLRSLGLPVPEPLAGRASPRRDPDERGT